MRNFTLTLTDEDGVILRRWSVTDDPNSEIADVIVPILGINASVLAMEINDTIGRVQHGSDSILDPGGS